MFHVERSQNGEKLEAKARGREKIHFWSFSLYIVSMEEKEDLIARKPVDQYLKATKYVNIARIMCFFGLTWLLVTNSISRWKLHDP